MNEFAKYVRTTKFASEPQEKGMRSLLLDLQKCGRLTDGNAPWAAIAWLIQKDHESAEYFSKAIGDHVARLEDQIKLLQEELRSLQNKRKPKEETKAEIAVTLP